jgi:C-terminal processing protease CtpA/Prc
MLPFLTANGFGVATAEILPGNIGRIELTGFPPPFRETRRRIDDAFTEVADTWGLIIDLTRNGGGTPPTVAYALSYLFDRPPFAIGGFRWRHRPEERTLTTLDLGGRRYGEGRPLAVTISSATFSGGEEFAYALKAVKRAVIVGEKSAGAANPGARYPLPGGFVGFVPQGRAVHPLTGTSWEGVGVVPDVGSARESVLPTAHRSVLEAVLLASDEPRRGVVQDALKALSG